MQTTTLKEWGARLPIGFPKGKGLEKTFALRPFKAKVERHLGNWKEANGGKYNAGQLLAMQTAKLLSLLISQAGSTQLAVADDGDSSAASELEIHKWFFSDVMYAYIFSRVQSLGSELESPVVCPMNSCGFSGMGQFDLNSVEVTVADSVEELYSWVDLQRPFLLRDGQTQCKSVRVGPVRWATMTKPGVLAGNMSAIALSSLQDSICAVNRKEDQPYQLSESELDEMEKIDRVRIDRLAGKASAGVDLNTTMKCPQCGAPIVNPLDWTYDSFFGSSLPLETSTT